MPRDEAGRDSDHANRLFYGDNLDILRGLPDGTVDLVYLDPPWNPRAAYNMIWDASKAQRHAFEGTWQWGPVAEEHYAYLTETARNRGAVPSPVSTLIAALRTAGTTPMLAYVVEMTVRLVELHRVLRSTGSLYLHSDPTASPYLRLVLDAIFGPKRFINEIVWKRQSSHNDAAQGAKHFGRIQDVILFYAKGADYFWQQPYRPYDESYLTAFYRHVEPGTERRYRLSDITAPGGAAPEKRNPRYEFLGVIRYWRFSEARMQELYEAGRIVQTKPGRVPQQKRYLDEMPGMPIGTWWDDIKPIQPKGVERTGWQTQKPLALLDRIVQASSRPGDVVLDPFCGCGTALDSAQGLNRRWIGIDITWHAIAVMKARLKARYGIDPQVEGAPTEVDGARHLAQQKPDGREQFEAWALTLVGAIPHGGPQRKGADQGADGIITFSGKAGLESAIVSVKERPCRRQRRTEAQGCDGAPRCVDGTLRDAGTTKRPDAPRGGHRGAVPLGGFRARLSPRSNSHYRGADRGASTPRAAPAACLGVPRNPLDRDPSSDRPETSSSALPPRGANSPAPARGRGKRPCSGTAPDICGGARWPRSTEISSHFQTCFESHAAVAGVVTLRRLRSARARSYGRLA